MYKQSSENKKKRIGKQVDVYKKQTNTKKA